jgi:hypothetical protein
VEYVVGRRGWHEDQNAEGGIQWRSFPSRVKEAFLTATEEQLPPYEWESLFFFDDYK